MSERPPQRQPNSSSAAGGDLGQIAEALVAQWLIQQGARVLHQRWRCRWGELDLIAQFPPGLDTAATLVFVEVKARQQTGWDAGGLLAITPQKQAKLWQAAELFLADHAELAEGGCRFDVALVWGRSRPAVPSRVSPSQPALTPGAPIQIGQPVAIAHYLLTLQHYLPNAFSNL